MKTYEQGRAPEGAPVTWKVGYNSVCRVFGIHGEGPDGYQSIAYNLRSAESICRAFHLAKLAEDYARACDRSDELRESDPFIETAEGLARAKACDAAHTALREAVR